MDSVELNEAKKGLAPSDHFKALDSSWSAADPEVYEMFTVYFKANEHDVVISMDVYKDRTFTVGRSSTVPTHHFSAYASAYARSLAFVEGLALQARL